MCAPLDLVAYSFSFCFNQYYLAFLGVSSSFLFILSVPSLDQLLEKSLRWLLIWLEMIEQTENLFQSSPLEEQTRQYML